MTIEDDTASIELLAFSNVLNQYGGYLRENAPVVITGRLSVREEKEPQIVVNRARPISDYSESAGGENCPQIGLNPAGTLYLQLPSEEDPRFRKVRAIVNMFPGSGKVVVFFADTRKKRGAQAALDERMIAELQKLLGEMNVVLK